MVTITSMKKIQEPDLLLDHPHPQPHRLPPKNNLNKPHRGSRTPSRKNRRHYPSEESNSSAISASTTLTSVSSLDGDDLGPVEVDPSHPSSKEDVIIEGLDENSPWSPEGDDQDGGGYPSHQKRPRSPPSQKSKSSPPRTSWIRTKATSSSTTHHGWDWRLPCCCSSLTTKQLIVLLIATLILSVSIISLGAVVLSRGSHSEVVSSSSVGSNNGGVSGRVGSNLLLSSSDISQNQGKEGEEEGAEEEEDEESENYDEYEESSGEDRNSDKSSSNSKLDLKEVSRLSWNMLNNNQERGSSSSSSGGGGDRSSSPSKGQGHRDRHHHRTQNPPVPSSFTGISGGQEVVLPSKMIFTSSDGDLESGSSGSGSSLSAPGSDTSGDGDNKNKKRPCCRTQKYAQVIKKEGCEPLTVTNRMCFGQCLSVWVPGLFASFPVCKPSRSSWKTVTLTCGKNRDRKRRVRIEKVRRCSCMEIDPATGGGSGSHSSDKKR